MPVDTSLVTLLTGSAGAVGVLAVFCVLFITGMIVPKPVVTDMREQLTAKDQQLKFERDRANQATAALQANHDLLSALQTGIQLARQQDTGGGRSP